MNDTCMHVPSVSEGRKPLRLQTFEISHFCWSPDFQLLFLVLREMRVACCDRMGEDLMKFLSTPLVSAGERTFAVRLDIGQSMRLPLLFPHERCSADGAGAAAVAAARPLDDDAEQ